MTGKSAQKTVLVLDDDLAFMAMLCFKLTAAGFVSVPAAAAERAVSLLEEMKIMQIDLLIVNFAVTRGINLLEVLRAENERLKIIAINGLHASPHTVAPIHGVIRKPSGPEQTSSREWLQVVERVLAAEGGRTERPSA